MDRITSIACIRKISSHGLDSGPDDLSATTNVRRQGNTYLDMKLRQL